MSLNSEKSKGIVILLAGTAVVFGGGIIVHKLLKTTGLSKDQEDRNREKIQTATTGSIDKDIALRRAVGQVPSYFDSTYLNAANIIDNSTRYSAVDDDNDTAILTLLRYTRIDLDYLMLQKAFGSRTHSWFGLPRNARTLAECLKDELSGSEKDRINIEWKKRGLTSRIF